MHHTKAQNADRIMDWIKNRGGIAIWDSINQSNPGKTWTTPANGPDGEPTTKPTWEAAMLPSQIITDPAKVLVDVPCALERFHVNVCQSSNGLGFKLTDLSSRRLRAALKEAGQSSWYEFDYETQEAVIWIPLETISLTEHFARRAAPPALCGDAAERNEVGE